MSGVLLGVAVVAAVAMAGFVIDSTVLVVAGALVAASGSILTALMAKAMNRSLLAVVRGGFCTDDSTGTTGPGGAGGARGQVHSVTADDVAVQLAYAHTAVVHGFGLAAWPDGYRGT